MVTSIVITIGLVALSRLRIDLLPEIENPTLSVSTTYEGASPEVVERLVTQIVEEIVATVPGVREMTSVSSEGRSNVQVDFVWGTDLDAAVADVRSRLEDEISELPEDIERPQIRKFDVGSFPVVVIGISSSLDPVELTELIDRRVRYRFARVPGVAQADIWGGFNREIRIELDRERIRALGIPLDQILDAIRDANLDRPAGQIEQGRYEVTLRAPAEFQSLEEIRNTVVVKRGDAIVTLGQIAEVKDTYEKLSRIVRVNGERGLRIGIRKQADANTVEVATAILDEIDRVNADFPQLRVVPVINQGNFIERSISNVARSVIYGGGLAILVLLFFLRNLRSTFVLALSIPVSIIATFAFVYFGGSTLNLMTLGGLALGVGMMVDNSIVVLENIFRRRDEESEPTRKAAVEGSGEVAGAIIAATITTLVIFLPLVFVRGVTGLLFKDFAFVIVVSLLCSLVVALTIVPMLASRLLKDDDPDPTSWRARLVAASERAFRRLESGYGSVLQFGLRHRFASLAVGLLLLVGSLFLAPFIGTEFLPPSDEGEVRVTGEMEIGTRLDLVDEQTKAMESIVVPAVPEAVSYVVNVGASGRRPDEASRGEIQLSLSAATQRDRSNTEIAQELRRRLNDRIPGMVVRTRAPQGQFLLERVLGGEEGLEIEIRGFDFATLGALANEVARVIADVPGITDVDVTSEDGVPQERVTIDRDKASDLGLTVRQVSEVLETAIAGRQAGDFRTEGNSFRIFVQLANVERLELEEILDLTVRSESGDDVALRNVVRVDAGRGPILIDRKDQQRLTTVKANVAGRDLGSVAQDAAARMTAVVKPDGYDIEISGSFEEQQEAFEELLVSLVLALALVYMVLACQYESLRGPLVVMFSVPLAAIGVLVTLFLTQTTLNLQSYIGCIMLGGIVVNNAILLVDQAGRLRVREGWATRKAVAEAGRRRLRPILMTTSTTIIGLLPLALGIGEGADAQAPLARAVIGGLTASTLITLVLVPVLYTLLHPETSRPRSSEEEPAASGETVASGS